MSVQARAPEAAMKICGSGNQPRRGVARMRFGHDRLADQGADPGHVDELGELTTRARAARRGEHQVGQFGLDPWTEPGPHVSRHAHAPQPA